MFGAKIDTSGTKWVEKTQQNFLFKNKRVWAEEIGKKWKNSKNLKVAGNYPNIQFTLVIQFFYVKNQNNQL